MRFWSFATILMSLPLLPCADLNAQAADSKPDIGANAALKYWQGFALLPALDQNQEKILNEWNKVPLDAAALKLIDESRQSLSFLHQGAMLDRCDWGLDYEEGIRLLVPHGVKSRTLARFAALDARREFEQAHWKAGWDDVVAMLRLARHVEADPIMINQLMGYAIESLAIEVAAPYVPELKAVLSKPEANGLNSLPPRPTLQQMVVVEKRLGPTWLIKELKAADERKQGSWQTVWKELFDAPGEGEKPRSDVAQSAKTLDQAIKMMEEVGGLHDELEALTGRTWKEFDDQYPAFAKKASAVNKAAAYILPNMGKLAPIQRRTQVQLEMFKASLAIIEGGPGKIQETKDPFGDGPFEYRALPKGFELKSKLLFNGQPVTLTVGKS
jgi:hypothetical protein